jgi:Zn-dependent metalloprotease
MRGRIFGGISGGLLATTVVAGLFVAPVDAMVPRPAAGAAPGLRHGGGTNAIQRDGGSSGAVADPSFGVAARTAALAVARAGTARTASALRLSTGQSLVVKDVLKDVDGMTHVRYDRTYRGLPVVGGDIVVHRRSTGRIASVDYASRGDLTAVPSVRARVPARVAVSAAKRSSGLYHSVARPSLAVWALGRVPRLAWRTEVSGRRAGAPARDAVYVDAVTGRRIQGWSTMETTDAVGTGNSLFDGQVDIHTNRVAGSSYQLRDLTRGNQATYTMNNQDFGNGTLLTDTDNIWGNGATTDAQTVAVDAHYGAAVTWDYYKNTFGRNGIRADGVGARSRVHYGFNYDNAFWNDDCFCMTYGDGAGRIKPLVSLDVAGHEMSHGVTSNTAGLFYLGESGGLNEATSDIFGSMVEFSANNSADPGDYYIGEKIVSGSGWLRRMDNPHLDGHSYNCYTPLMGRDDVHYTSGVANHFFYLLAEGSGAKSIGGRAHNSPTCNGTALAGIGRTKAQRIWYRALTVYMTSGTNYRDARDATIRAARDLYGGTGGACKAVVRTWTAVTVGPGLWGCSGLLTAGGGVNKIKNGGFEAGRLHWVGSAGFIARTPQYARTGKGYVWLDPPVFDQMSVQQTLRLPRAKRITLTYFLLVNSVERRNAAQDKLVVRAVKPDGSVVPLGKSSNTAADDTYHRRTADLSSLRGKKITVRFVASQDSSPDTVFLIDDVSVKAG